MQTIGRVLKCYREAARLATKSLLKAPLVLLFSALAYVAMQVAIRIFGPFGMAGGFALGMVQIALLTYFYSWISAAVQRDKVNFSNFHEFDGPLFMRLISVAFIFFIVTFLVQSTTQGLVPGTLQLFLGLAIVFLFNAIPEVVVVRGYEGLSALQYALGFARDNFFAWFTPLLAMVAPLIMLSADGAILLVAQTDPLLPAFLIFRALRLSLELSTVGIVAVPLAIIATVWCTLFRMHLFSSLDGMHRYS